MIRPTLRWFTCDGPDSEGTLCEMGSFRYSMRGGLENKVVHIVRWPNY